jgi:hypothetical protein
MESSYRGAEDDRGGGRVKIGLGVVGSGGLGEDVRDDAFGKGMSSERFGIANSGIVGETMSMKDSRSEFLRSKLGVYTES